MGNLYCGGTAERQSQRRVGLQRNTGFPYVHSLRILKGEHQLMTSWNGSRESPGTKLTPCWSMYQPIFLSDHRHEGSLRPRNAVPLRRYLHKANKNLLPRTPGQHVCWATWRPRFLTERYEKPGPGVKDAWGQTPPLGPANEVQRFRLHA